MKMIQRTFLSILLASCSMATLANSDLKAEIEKQGFEFVKQISAPKGMTGWAGHSQQKPNTVFISDDQQYYIIGDLYNAKNENLSLDVINNEVKVAVLDDVWKTLEHATWMQDGQKDAPRIVYVFSDPNCPYCHKLWTQARPWVESGKVQLRHIQVGVIRDESRAQVATLLMSKNPETVFADMNLKRGNQQLKKTENIPQEIADKIDANQALMDKYGFFSTPSMIWRDAKGEVQFLQGMTTDPQTLFEK